MKGILVQRKILKVIDGNFSADLSKRQMEKSNELAYNLIILHLSDVL